MDFIYVGDIVNTHALKGEMRIVSFFDYKEAIYQKDFPFYIGDMYEKHFLSSYRKHKEYDLLTFHGIDTIEKANIYKGKSIYVKRDSVSATSYFIEDFINLSVYEKDVYIGKIIEVEESKAHKIFLLDNYIRIPYVDVYVKKIDLQNQRMYVERVRGFLDEN